MGVLSAKGLHRFKLHFDREMILDRCHLVTELREALDPLYIKRYPDGQVTGYVDMVKYNALSKSDRRAACKNQFLFLRRLEQCRRLHRDVKHIERGQPQGMQSIVSEVVIARWTYCALDISKGVGAVCHVQRDGRGRYGEREGPCGAKADRAGVESGRSF